MTLDDVLGRLERGVANSRDFAWCEGMETWKRVEEIPELTVRPAGLAQRPAESAGTADLSALIEIRSDVDEAERVAPARRRSAPRSEPSLRREEPVHPVLTASPARLEPDRVIRPRRRWGRILGALLFLGLLGAGATVYSQGLWVRWFPPVPRLEDLSEEQNQELLQAAAQSLAREGPVVAIALSTQNAGAPSVYLTTNLPEGTNLEVRLHGLGPTLLNEIEFDLVFPVVVTQRSAKTPPIRMKDGGAIPAGQYVVYVVDGADQPARAAEALEGVRPASGAPPAGVPAGRKILANRTYTVLGGLRDETYSSLLREYHAKLREQASSELRELGDWAGVLTRQLEATRATFQKSRGKPAGDSRRREWSGFHEEWTKELASYLGDWEPYRPGSAVGKVFYGPLYEQVYLAGQALLRLHDLQTAALTPPADLAVYAPEVKGAEDQALSRLQALKDKLQSLEKGWDQSGYPPREGAL